MEDLDSGQIHLWLAYPGEITDPRLLADYRALLSEEELEKQQRFHFERDRHRYLITRAMVRTVLSKYAEVGAGEWRFTANSYGRPSIAPEMPATGIEFNVSHTDGLVVACITRERAIGVDVENVRTRDIDIGIADRYFAPAEVSALRALPRERQLRRFFEYWTLKESYIKARGMGLSIPLERFAFDLEHAPQIRLIVDPALDQSAKRWMFWRPHVKQYQLAVCAEHTALERLELLPAFSWPLGLN